MSPKPDNLLEEQAQFVLGAPPAPDADVTVLHTPSGPVVSWRGQALQSVRNAAVEAARRSGEIPTADTLLFFGAAVGTVVQKALETQEAQVIWFEPLPGILHAALSETDVRPWLRKGTLRIFCGKPSQDDIARLLEGCRNTQTAFVPHRASYKISTIYEEVQRGCERILNRREVNMATLARFDRTWTRNLYENFSFLGSARPVSRLFLRAQGRAAVIVGAGPSLYESLSSLQSASAHALVIAVDTALLILQQAGIDPDIVVTVDPQPLNRSYLEGYIGDALFVVDPTTSFHSLRLLDPARTFFTWSPFPLARLFMDHLTEQPGEISFGGSVSTNAYDLAVRMGCSRIHLVGQDLSFPGGMAHSKGAILEERLNIKESRVFRREMHNYRQMSALPVRYLKGLDGQPVATNDKLLIFHNWFSSRVPADMERGIRVVNSTSRGAFIPPLPHGSLSEIPQSKEVRATRKLLRTAASRSTKFDRTGLVRSLRNLKQKLEGSAAILNKSVGASESLIAALTGPHNPRNTAIRDASAARLDELDSEFRKEAEVTEIIGNAAQAAIFRVTEGWGEQSGRENTDVHNAQRAHRLYQEMEKAALLQVRWISRAIRFLER